MKKYLLGLSLLTATARVWAGDTEFSRTLSPEDLKATGLDRLTLGQRQRLDEMIAAYKQDAVAAVRQSAAGAHAAEAGKVEAGESRAGGKGFFAKARLMVVPGTQIEYAEIKTTIPGKFDGWEAGTVFRLANGQRWQVANGNERYYTPVQHDMEVEIRPSAFGGFWMYFPAIRSRVRVKLLDDK